MSQTRPAHPYARAFTLIELSIVLVIIALLAGGIASLRTYVRNATLSTIMNEGKLYISAFNQFQTRYGAPPGDYCSTATVCSGTASTVWPTASNGDANGLVRATNVAGDGYRNELFYSFQQLALAGFIQGVYSGATVGGVGTFDARIGTNVAGDRKERVAYLFDHPDFTDGVPDGFITSGTDPLFFNGQYPNVLRIAQHPDGTAGLPRMGFLTPQQALNLDEKFDDGFPGRGMIVTPKLAGLANCASSDDPTTATYLTGQGDPNCWFIVKIQ